MFLTCKLKATPLVKNGNVKHFLFSEPSVHLQISLRHEGQKQMFVAARFHSLLHVGLFVLL